jgi:hypothetical protein
MHLFSVLRFLLSEAKIYVSRRGNQILLFVRPDVDTHSKMFVIPFTQNFQAVFIIVQLSLGTMPTNARHDFLEIVLICHSFCS